MGRKKLVYEALTLIIPHDTVLSNTPNIIHYISGSACNNQNVLFNNPIYYL